MSDHVFIENFQPAQFISGVYAVQNCQLGMTKNGKPFLKALIADKSGRTPLRMWSITEEHFATLPTDGFVYLEGQTQPYQGEMQMIAQKIHAHQPTNAEFAFLIPSSKFDIDQMFAEVVRILGSIQQPALRCLADRYLEDGSLMDKFCKAPAAQTLHHAFLGGLLEHTLSLMKVADALLPLYPQLSRDLVIFGVFLHDLGKCAELTWETGFGYTTDGQLVGHIARGSIWLEEKARACEDPELGEAVVRIPADLLAVLHHIILSHHGLPEYGALKVPATPEAIFISMVDNLDAKMNMALGAARESGGPGADAEFTEKIWALGNVRLYRPDPTAGQS